MKHKKFIEYFDSSIVSFRHDTKRIYDIEGFILWGDDPDEWSWCGNFDGDKCYVNIVDYSTCPWTKAYNSEYPSTPSIEYPYEIHLSGTDDFYLSKVYSTLELAMNDLKLILDKPSIYTLNTLDFHYE